MAPKLPPCLSEVAFGSLLVYSPHGTSDSSIKSRAIAQNIKFCRAGYVEYAVGRLREEMQPRGSAAALDAFLGPEVLVVPCPQSAPMVAGALWPPKEICDELVRQGLAARSVPLLKRTQAVQKSSFAGPGKRPKPMEHIASMAVIPQPELPTRRITVVDDVLTKGATLIAAASHIKDAFPEADVRVFSMVRTRGLVPDVDEPLEPVVGRISFDGFDARREP